MGERKQCGTCGEVVDEAKAFCPGCGTAFVEEKKRASASEFDLSNRTVQLGQTMYNQMLSDMGLSIPKQKPSHEEARPEKVAPAATVQPAAGTERKVPMPAPQPLPEKPTNPKLIFALLGLAALIGILILAIAIFVAVVYFL